MEPAGSETFAPLRAAAGCLHSAGPTLHQPTMRGKIWTNAVEFAKISDL